MLEKGSFPKKKQGKKHRGGGKRIHPCTLLFCVRMYSVHALRELVVNRQLSGKEKERSLLLKEGRREKAETHAKLSSPTPISTPRASHSPSVCLPPTFFFAVRVQNSERRQQQDTKRYSQLGPFLFALIQYTVHWCCTRTSWHSPELHGRLFLFLPLQTTFSIRKGKRRAL